MYSCQLTLYVCLRAVTENQIAERKHMHTQEENNNKAL